MALRDAFKMPSAGNVPALADLPAPVGRAVLETATADIAQQSKRAMPAHLFLLVGVFLASGASDAHRGRFLAGGLLMLAVGLTRLHMVVHPQASDHWWRRFGVLTAVHGFLWGALGFDALVEQGLTVGGLVFLGSNVGMAGVGIGAFKANGTLARVFVALILGPLVVATALAPGAGVGLAITLLVGIAVLFRLARDGFQSSWAALLNEARLQQHSEELEEARVRAEAALSARDVFVEKIERQRDELGRLQERTNDDLAIAERLLRNILLGTTIDFSSLRLRRSALERFNGDIAMVLPVAGNKLRFFVGDFTGHGLGAAVGAMPVGDIFMAAARRGLLIETSLREMNSKLRRILPSGMFLAAFAGELDVATGRLLYWNGGLPDGYVLRADGGVRARLPSTHLPIGILNDADFDSTVDIVETALSDRFFVCTDGVMETSNAVGETFGEARIEEILTTPSPDRFWSSRLDTALESHRGAASLRDDTTYLEIHFDEGLRRQVDESATTTGVPPWRTESLHVRLHPDRLRAPDPLSELREFLTRHANGERAAAIAINVVSELVVNAIDHGVLGLDSQLKDGPDGFGSYFALREERLAGLTKGAVAVLLQVSEGERGRLLHVRVEDTGRGFAVPEPDSVPARGDEAAVHGRGLMIVRTLSKKAVWSDGGRVAEVDLVLDEESDTGDSRAEA